jgi:hypothetical protein
VLSVVVGQDDRSFGEPRVKRALYLQHLAIPKQVKHNDSRYYSYHARQETLKKYADERIKVKEVVEYVEADIGNKTDKNGRGKAVEKGAFNGNREFGKVS